MANLVGGLKASFKGGNAWCLGHFKWITLYIISIFTSDYVRAARIFKLRIIHFSNIRILLESHKCGKELLTEQEPPPSTITLQLLPPRTTLAAGISSVCIRKRCACVTTVSIIVGTKVPPQCPHPAAIYFRCIFRDAFFVTLRFSNLVPYVAILRTFHVKITLPTSNEVRLQTFVRFSSS